MKVDVERWLRDLGLGRYARTFAENAIDLDVLPELSEQDLVELGVSPADREQLRRAVGSLFQEAAAPYRRADTGRRQVTLMLADLVGATGLDPEDMSAISRPYEQACVEVVEPRDGHVVDLIGGDVLACFVWPRAHEDDAERAVRAGLELAERIARLTGSGGAPLAARVGLATGLVMVGDLIGEGAAATRTVVGGRKTRPVGGLFRCRRR